MCYFSCFIHMYTTQSQTFIFIVIITSIFFVKQFPSILWLLCFFLALFLLSANFMYILMTSHADIFLSAFTRMHLFLT